GLPAFGPEALVVQLAGRPASFTPWADFVAHLPQAIADCDDSRLADLLTGQSASTWQRAAYLIHAGGQPARGMELLNHRPRGPMPKVSFEHPDVTWRGDGAPRLWISRYHVVDRLIAPLQRTGGKA
ncbi:MAG: type IV toxin-antitoxin system AbiEi family antitoxin, partial [Actinopolymorphaceae bacterium]